MEAFHKTNAPLNRSYEEIFGRLLTERNITIALAESCTGGQVMKQLTDVSGSSSYLLGGVVAYSNDVKINILKVPREIITEHGAVSEQTARLMATGVKELIGSSVGVGITGIAGPEGDSTEKPVGLVYIALAGFNDLVCQKHLFKGERQDIRKAAVQASLEMISRFIEMQPNYTLNIYDNGRG